MNVAVAVAVGIVATLLVAMFGTILILLLLAMHRIQNSLVEVMVAFNAVKVQARALDANVGRAASLIDSLSVTFRALRSDIHEAARASMRSAESVQNLDRLLTGAQPTAATPVPPGPPPRPPQELPRMDGPRPNVPPNPLYDVEAPKEDGTETLIVDDEEMAKLQDQAEAREQGYETDPLADFPIPIRGVGVDAG